MTSGSTKLSIFCRKASRREAVTDAAMMETVLEARKTSRLLARSRKESIEKSMASVPSSDFGLLENGEILKIEKQRITGNLF